MKNSIILAGAVLACGAAQADISCLAPGYTRSDIVIGQNNEWVTQYQNLGTFWSYKITGVQYKLTSAARFDGAVWKGDLVLGLHGNDKQVSYPGTSYVWVWANGQWIETHGAIHSTRVDDTTGIVTVEFNPPLEFHDENVSIGFAYHTNMRTDADMVRVLGEAVLAPPVPTGDISAPNVVRTGASPDLDWDLTRVSNAYVVDAVAEDGSETTDTSTNSDEQTTTTDGTDGTTTTTDGTDGTTTTDGTINNGHGNNLDGVDISNPGKSAQKWNDHWGIIDTSAPDDDEVRGGGSAVSLAN